MKYIILAMILSVSTQAFAKGGGFKFLDDLNLTEEQLVKIKEYRKAHKQKRKDIKGDKKAQQEKMKQLFIDGASDSEMKKLHGEITNHRNVNADLRLEKMIFMKNTLTKEQRKTFMEKREGKKKNRKKRNRRNK